MKITFVIPSIGCGGAERVLVSLASGFIQHGYDVTVVTLSTEDRDFYQLPSACSRLALGILGSSTGVLEAISNNIQRVSVLRKAIASTAPDLVVSFLRITNITTIMALLGSKYPLIVTEHNDLGSFSYGAVWETLRRLTYPFCTGIVSVSKGVDSGFTFIPETKRAVIYNPILVRHGGIAEQLPPEVDPHQNWLVSMGRLTKQKRFDLLLQAFSQIATHHPNWQLLILGKGELEDELLTMRDDLGLSGRVVFTGALSNPFSVLRQAKLFVMASENEGFPMAHGEALACGLPVVCTDCPSGPSEMIRQDIDGLLVPNRDVSALARAIESLMDDEPKRKALAARAPEVLERFGLDATVAEWEILIDELVEQ
ncbi:MAG: glycosyltransferase family 4 protein [Cyanobacteria bacterium J06635_13]